MEGPQRPRRPKFFAFYPFLLSGDGFICPPYPLPPPPSSGLQGSAEHQFSAPNAFRNLLLVPKCVPKCAHSPKFGTVARNLQKVTRRAFQKTQICHGACRRTLWLKYVLKSETECRLSHLPPQILKNVLRFSTFGVIFQDNWKLCTQKVRMR